MIKRIISIVGVSFLCSISIATAIENVTGGIVYPKGDKIIYQDIQTGEKKDLIEDLEIKGVKAASVSPSKKKLVFVDTKNKVWKRSLPNGDLKRAERAFKEKSGSKLRRYTKNTTIKDKEIRNFRVSFSANLVAYKRDNVKEGMKMIKKDDPDYLKKVNRKFSGKNRKGGRYEHDFVYIEDVEKEYKEVIAIPVTSFPKAAIFFTNTFNFGNPILYPRRMPYLIYRDGNEMRKTSTFFGLFSDYGYTPELSHRSAVRCFSMKRDAIFYDWHPKEDRIAVMYKTKKGWGPIEIRNVDLDLKWGKSRIPSKIFIEIFPPSCKGISWRTDGALTILVNNRIHVFEAEKIKRALKESQRRWGNKSAIKHKLTPEINWFKIKPGESLPFSLHGEDVQWISENSLIFRDNYGSIHLRRGKVRKKILDNVPDDFTYCPEF